MSILSLCIWYMDTHTLFYKKQVVKFSLSYTLKQQWNEATHIIHELLKPPNPPSPSCQLSSLNRRKILLTLFSKLPSLHSGFLFYFWKSLFFKSISVKRKRKSDIPSKTFPGQVKQYIIRMILPHLILNSEPRLWVYEPLGENGDQLISNCALLMSSFKCFFF